MDQAENTPKDPHDQAFFEQMRGCRDNYRKLADAIHAVVGKQESCLDIGCGIGLQTARLKELGWEQTSGAEFSPFAIEMMEPGVTVHEFDLTKKEGGCGFRGDWGCVICTETAEHIPEHHSLAIVDNVASLARDVIVWSAAAPGQEWEGHINLQYPDYWLTRFRAHGWVLDEGKTAQLRGLMEMKQAQHYLGRQNFCVLVKSTERPLHFTIVSTVFNAERWIGKCIESVRRQTFRNYTHIVVDARSDDQTGAIADREAAGDPQLTVIHNEVRQEALENCWAIWKDLPDDEVIVWLDGDDWLAHDAALEVIANAYYDPNTWLTYGQFMFSDGEVGFAAPYPPGAAARYMDWRATHLKTFRAGLVKKLLSSWEASGIPGCLTRPNGSWIYLAIDKAVMWPLLEMAGEHYRCIYQVVSVYNFQASWAAQRKPEHRQVELNEAERIRALPPFQPLLERPW
ncbi:MAG: glycosyltransferase [Pseudomonadota bacterium]